MHLINRNSRRYLVCFEATFVTCELHSIVSGAENSFVIWINKFLSKVEHSSCSLELLSTELDMDSNTNRAKSETISQRTRNILEAAERKALISMSTKEQSLGARRDELNLLDELRKYRRSEEMKPKQHSPFPRRKAKSI